MGASSRKHIADPIHGAIDVRDHEFDVIDTPTFQRLRRIKQLAMASQVYPGADHSRFVHSLGVFALTGRMVARLRELHPDTVGERDEKILRLAALLHDVGHYPYSHLLEKLKLPAKQDTEIAQTIEPKENGRKAEPTPTQYPKHDEVGAGVVLERADIMGALRSNKVEPQEIAKILTYRHGEKPWYNQVISRDLDTDRLDYLLRDAHFTGVPYGGIDIEYILRNVELDDEDNVCITPKAILSAEHFLLGRWFNYGAVVYQKTVMGMEALLRALLQRMASSGLLPDCPKRIWEIVEDPQGFLEFDDHYVDAEIRKLAYGEGPPKGPPFDDEALTKLFAVAVMHRVKPRCVFEAIQEPAGHNKSYALERFDTEAAKKIASWASQRDVQGDLWFTGDSKERSLEEVRPYESFTDEVDDESGGDAQKRRKGVSKLIRVADGNGKSSFLADRQTSLVHPLSKAKFRVARIYVLLPEEVLQTLNPPDKRRWRTKYKRRAEEIRSHIARDLGL